MAPLIWRILRWGVGLVFVSAGALKASNPQGFAYAVENYQLTTWSVSIGIAFYLPWLEIVAGAAMVTGRLYRGALALLVVMTVGFLAALSSAWARGLNIECGCFQSESQPDGLGTSIGIDLLVLGLLIALAWNETRSPERTALRRVPLKGRLPLTLTALISLAQAGQAAPPISLAQAGSEPGLKLSWATDGRTQITVTLENTLPTPRSVEIPWGQVCVTPSGARVLAINTLNLEVGASAKTHATAAAIALSTKHTGTAGSCDPTPERVPRLDALLRELRGSPPVPRQTAQLLALILLENISFSEWQTFLGRAPFPPAPAPTDNAPAFFSECLDALAMLPTLAPSEKFAFAEDPDLKRRVLRQPTLRLRALRLYGMEPPEGLPEAPDINRLLHKQPGDNCPACQARSRGAPPQDTP
jgi:uncharacterized membrane protein YphA (DoxX/SURF4 family)